MDSPKDDAGILLDGMTRLYEVGELCVRPGRNLDRCLEAILHAAIDITAADKGNIQILDPDTGALSIKAQCGFGGPFLGFFSRVDPGHASASGAASRELRRVLVEDVKASEIFAGQPSLDIMLDAGVRAVQSTPLVSSSGAVLGMISTHFASPRRPRAQQLRLLDLLARQAADYLERQRSEEKVRELTNQLRQTTDTLGTGLTLCSRDLRYLSANLAYADLAGVPRDQIVGRSIMDVIGEDAFALIRPYIDRVLSGERVEYEVELPWRANARAWIHGVYEPYRDAVGRVTGWVASITDISKLKRAEAALKDLNESLEREVQARAQALQKEMTERQKLAEALQQKQRLEAIGQLTGGIAHDFNNLLTVVSGNLELIGRASRIEESRRLAGTAQKAAERGAELVRTLLAFARKQALQPQTVEVNSLIQEFAPILKGAAGGNAELHFALSPVSRACRIDPAQFQSALLNLVTNAVAAMPDGGRITIETGSAQIADPISLGVDLAPGHYLAVSVADTGKGMPPEVLAHAFEPFFSTKDIAAGRGLGLAQVYGFVKQSGGDVELRSAVGSGTSVKLLLPEAAPEGLARARVKEAIAPQRRAGSATLLVVEDDGSVREFLVEGLVSLGYTVIAAEDAREALDAIEKNATIDLVLTDHAMPRGMTGRELIDRLAEIRPGLQALLISGYAAVDSKGIGGYPVLNKPIRLEALAKAVEESLARER